MKRTRAEAGAYARGAGKAFEELLDWQHKQYRQAHQAWIEFTGTRARAVRRGDDVIFVAGHSMPDYVGVLAGGRAIVFDAKTTDNKYSWSLHRDKIHQRDTLSLWAEFGAIAFFAIESRRAEALYLYRIHANETWPETDPPHLSWSDFSSYPGLYFSAEGKEVLKMKADMMGRYDYLPEILNSWVE